MAKFCSKCGTQLRDAARFCSVCGTQVGVLRSNRQQSSSQPVPNVGSAYNTSANSYSNTPSYSGGTASDYHFQNAGAAPAPGATYQQNSNYPFGSASAPSADGTPTMANPVPQFFQSYDYQPQSQAQPASPPPPGSYNSGSSFNPGGRDSSRPLPPLSDFFNEDSSKEDRRELAKDTIMNFSLWAAAIVLMPIPFADLVLLMPIQSAMVIAVGKVYGVKETPERVLAIIAGSCGASVFGQVTALLLSNMIPFIGSLVSAPFIFGWTYGLGEVAIRYFETKGQATDSELKSIFKNASKDASKKYDPSKVSSAQSSLNNLRQYMSEEDYNKIKNRFGPEAR